MTETYHAFFTVCVGGKSEYRRMDNLSDVLALVAEQYETPERLPRICNLRVVYGQLLEFEPVEIVKSYRVKEWRA